MSEMDKKLVGRCVRYGPDGVGRVGRVGIQRLLGNMPYLFRYHLSSTNCRRQRIGLEVGRGGLLDGKLVQLLRRDTFRELFSFEDVTDDGDAGALR